MFIGYAIMNALGGLVEGRLYTALVQFLSPLFTLIVIALYLNWEEKKSKST